MRACLFVRSFKHLFRIFHWAQIPRQCSEHVARTGKIKRVNTYIYTTWQEARRLWHTAGKKRKRNGHSAARAPSDRSPVQTYKQQTVCSNNARRHGSGGQSGRGFNVDYVQQPNKK